MFEKDPVGFAIIDYSKGISLENITVESNLCEDDIIPVKHLFRTYIEMPEIEKMAIDQCKGAILDIGAAAGCHSNYLKSIGKKSFAIDTSKGAIEYLTSNQIACKNIPFENPENEVLYINKKVFADLKINVPDESLKKANKVFE